MRAYLLERYSHRKRAALALLRVETHATAHQLGQLGADAQTETSALKLLAEGHIALEERLKPPLLHMQRHPLPGVLDFPLKDHVATSGWRR